MHDRERKIAAIAGRQDNVVTREQLTQVGLGVGAIAHRLVAGTLQRLHRGVYLLGAAPPSAEARARAAVLVCAPAAYLSHRSAAALWRLLPEIPVEDLDVTVVGRNPGVHPGLRVHRSRTLGRPDIRHRHGIPLTSPARTLCDLAATEPTNVLERALNEARVLGLAKQRELDAALKRAQTRKGTALLRLLNENPTITRNDAERKLLKLISDANLPRPLTNAPLQGYNVDFLWPAQRLIVEFDGFASHGHRHAFEKDRRRDRTLVAAGYRVIRITWRQLVEEPLAVIASVAQALIAAA
jgi:very-short-patch-repair endonuclease